MNFDRLYEVGFQYKKTKLWKKLWEQDIFAVKFDDGVIAYLSVMGRMGDYCALAIYVGDEGYRGYQNLLHFRPDLVESEFEMKEMAVSQNCLHLSLDGKDDMDKEELSLVRAYAKSHGIRLSGKNAYPRFLKFEPGCLPWGLNTERDGSYVYQAAMVALRMAELIEDKDVRAQLNLGLEDHFPLLEMKDGQYTFTGMIKAPKLKKIPLVKPGNLNEIGIRSLKKCKKKGTFECEMVMMPAPIQDDPKVAPYFPYTLMAVERLTGFMIPPIPVKDYRKEPEKMVNYLIDMMLEQKVCPDSFLVRDERTYAMLEKLAKKLNVSIQIDGDLDMLDEAQDELLNYLDEGERDEDALGDIMDFVEMLLSLDDDEIEQIPPELMFQLEMLLDMEVLPEEIAMELEERFF